MRTINTYTANTSTTWSAKIFVGACLVAAALGATAEVQAATPTYYANRATFEALMDQMVTDDYSNAAYTFTQNNAVMSAVLGETDYQSTGFTNLNIVSQTAETYCAGCNGSFQFSFTTTTIGTSDGVFGAGVDVLSHTMTVPYFAFITFGDNSTDNVALPAAGNFWGVTAPERVKSIHFGLTGGATTQSGSFRIDNLTIGGVTPSVCGDGSVDEGEACDDDNTIDGDGCSADCLSDETCGNGILDTAAGEVCDDDNTADDDGCSADCASDESCGNGIVDTAAGEACDDKNNNDGDGCSADCASNESCGNGILDDGEACDDKNNTDGDGCSANCLSDETCGNGTVDTAAGEACDDKNSTDGDGCSADCASDESCGNGMLDDGEACDDNNNTDGDGCAANCELPDCGNGILDSGETCDDNNNTDGDGCAANCASNETCGNGILDSAAGEACDDGNTTAGDGCEATCTEESTPDCGNGVLNNGEECDEGPQGSAVCAVDCTLLAGTDGQGADSQTVGGCGCSVIGDQSRPRGVALGFMALGLVLARRRRRRRATR